ncbi:MAG: hypothetical protein IJP45_07770 [Paludibacteraceae bacterium]|nr:hypothetical protein [Paludibacteraceae bacterium]
MLGFSTSNGVEIKGRYARGMREQEERFATGNLNKHDKQLVRFVNEKPEITLIREY